MSWQAVSEVSMAQGSFIHVGVAKPDLFSRGASPPGGARQMSGAHWQNSVALSVSHQLPTKARLVLEQTLHHALSLVGKLY